MDTLFIIEGKKVLPTPELLLLEPFRKIWEDYEKEYALDIMAYIFFMTSHNPDKNPFIGYSEMEKAGKVLSSLPSGQLIQAKLLEEGEDDILSAMSLISELEDEGSPSMNFYRSSLNAAQSIISFFNDIDLSRTSPKTGMPLYKPADITRALKETTEVLKTLQGLKDKVRQELFDSSRTTKERRISKFERA